MGLILIYKGELIFTAGFPIFSFLDTWWKLFQKCVVVRAKLDIYLYLHFYYYLL